MKREEILAMPAGRELDWEVAKFMDINEKAFTFAYEAGNYNYSTDISAAWEVVKHLSENYGVSVYEDDGAPCECKLYHWSKEPLITADGGTAPEVICKAALLAVMEGQAHETN